MAGQNPYQVRPFMPKQTFDQVSAMMWGQGALDYNTNYIVPRVHWDDSDIREEALYFAGLAQGFRVGASQKPSQPMMNEGSCQDKPNVPVDVNSDQTGFTNSIYLASAKHGSFRAAFQPQVAANSGPSHRPGVATPLEILMNSHSQPALSHHEPSHFGAPYQRINTTAANGADQEIEEPFGVLSAPDGTTLTIPITDGQASKVLNHSPASEPPVVTRKENNIMNPLFETIPESIFGEDYHDVATPLTLEDDDDQERYHEEMERYFGGQEQESDDVLSDIENGTYME